MQTLKTLYRDKHDQLWELFRYIVAGVLTTAVSMVISYGLYFILAVNTAPDMPEGRTLAWITEVMNLATPPQVAIANGIAWVAAVIFAFWINRKMVFRVKYSDQTSRLKAFLQFVSARVATLLVFELGLAALLSAQGTPNTVGRIIVMALVILFNYFASKFWVFKHKSEGDSHP